MSQYSLRSQHGSANTAIIVGSLIIAVIIAVALSTHGFGMHPQSTTASENGSPSASDHMAE